jgi:hypothetical protein
LVLDFGVKNPHFTSHWYRAEIYSIAFGRLTDLLQFFHFLPFFKKEEIMDKIGVNVEKTAQFQRMEDVLAIHRPRFQLPLFFSKVFSAFRFWTIILSNFNFRKKVWKKRREVEG